MGIQAPGRTSVPGNPDFITLDEAEDGTIFVWDSKYRAPNNPNYPKSIPADKMEKWHGSVIEAVNNMPPGAAKDTALNALENGRIVGEIFKWPN